MIPAQQLHERVFSVLDAERWHAGPLLASESRDGRPMLSSLAFVAWLERDGNVRIYQPKPDQPGRGTLVTVNADGLVRLENTTSMSMS